MEVYGIGGKAVSVVLPSVDEVAIKELFPWVGLAHTIVPDRAIDSKRTCSVEVGTKTTDVIVVVTQTSMNELSSV